MKFTIDLMCGWAHPGVAMVRNSPGYPRTWFATALKRKMTAPDGYVWMYAVRLLGLTLGVTITRECVTSATSSLGSSLPQQQASASGQAPQQVQLPPELMAQIQAHLQKQQSQQTPSP